MVEASRDSKIFGKALARYVAECGERNTLADLKHAMDRFTKRTGASKDIAGRIRGSIARGNFNLSLRQFLDAPVEETPQVDREADWVIGRLTERYELGD